MKRIPLLQLLQLRFPDMEKKLLYASILCGEVRVNGERVMDPKRSFPPETEVELHAESRRYVSRGGEKLEAAVGRWDLPIAGRVWLDAGASTGGFTHCLLQHGAKLVHSVDVGYNQLDYRLRSDARVRVHERTNIMELTALDPPPAAAVADLSFRSLRGAATHLLSLTKEQLLIALAKPQFETPRLREADFDGLIREPEEAARILAYLVAALEGEQVRAYGILPSPLPGRKGNREFLMLLGRSSERAMKPDELYRRVVAAYR
jgi:23S rRNA (cytidine1920-2'-O)/16S rRNA (cytidine1409-2'-O)-methyltransferase